MVCVLSHNFSVVAVQFAIFEMLSKFLFINQTSLKLFALSYCCAVLFRLLLVSVSIMSPAALCAAAVCVSPRRRRPGQPLRRLPAAALVPGHCACAVTWPVYKRPVARGRGSPGITTLAATTPPLTQGSRHSLETGVLPPYSGAY